MTRQPGLYERLLARILLNPGSTLVVTGFVLALGLFTARSLSVDLFPPLDFPTLNVVCEEPDYSSLEMEQRVTLPVEAAAESVPGVVRVRSDSATGIAMVSVGFVWGTDMWQARERLQQALIDAQGQIPAGVRTSVETLSSALSMIEGYSLRSRGDPVALRDLALYRLKPRLQRLPGVYRVEVVGGQSPEIRVTADPARLEQYGLTLDDLSAALAANNVASSPGVANLGPQELVLHGRGQYGDPAEVAQVAVAVRDGSPVRVGQVARVRPGYRYQRGDSSEDGQPAVLVTVSKQLGYDTGSVADAVAREVASFRRTLPAGVRLDNYYDQAKLVRDSIGGVRDSVWIGGVLVVLVLALFLGDLKATLVAALSIPVSVVTALLLMRVFGVQLNIMSLGGLAIGTGMIVDDTVVVLENIFRWLSTPELGAGRGRLEVVTGACREVAVPVLVSTLANIGIFLPMVLVAGFAGKLFAPVSLTVTFALLASLAVSQTLIPQLALRWLKDVRERDAPRLERAYRGPLDFALRHPAWVLALAAVAVLGSVAASRRLDMGFLPDLDEGAVLVSTLMPPGTSLAEARRVNSKIEAWLERMPGVVTVVRRTGHAPGAEDTDNVNHSDIMVKLAPKNRRPLALKDWIDAVEDRTADLPGVNVEILMPLADKINDALGGVPADIGVNLEGPDLAVLGRESSALQASLARVPGLVDVHPQGGLPVPSLEVRVDRAAAGRLGIPVRSVFETLEACTGGLVATEVRHSLQLVPVTVRYGEPGADIDLTAVEHLPLRTAAGTMVPLGEVARLGYGAMPSDIEHTHLVREVTLTGNIQGRAARDVASDVARAVERLRLPAGYAWSLTGKFQAGRRAIDNLLMVLGLSIAVVALILWFEFQDLARVGLILLTIPLAAVGAIFSLAATGQSLNVSSMIGAVLLVGIVVRNGIILLDTVDLELRSGRPLERAIREAARKRLSRIRMTATVTLLGLLPLAVGWGSGAELQRPLAIAVVGGTLTSTLLTLVVLPAASRLALGGRAKPPQD